MTLRETVDRYVAWQRDHGAKFRSSAETLDAFCRGIGEDRNCDSVGEDEIRGFLAGKTVLTRTRAVKYGTLAGFYRFALSRRHVSCIPMPPREAEPRPPEVAPSFIFTHEELRRLFKAAGGGPPGVAPSSMPRPSGHSCFSSTVPGCAPVRHDD